MLDEEKVGLHGDWQDGDRDGDRDVELQENGNSDEDPDLQEVDKDELLPYQHMVGHSAHLVAGSDDDVEVVGINVGVSSFQKIPASMKHHGIHDTVNSGGCCFTRD